ncbi:response regulator [Mammaliicoccus sciuri]|uniref:Transcriptional regulatory protein n=2 Tax=Sporosarcina newyorkensis TaxID=759851 RepID=A0A1T4Y0C3_9BACL|nr:response regulator [Sporosarcina newyorkensis]EGQ26884.1 DASS family divalent anion:sodium (Na+) symporter [Sporosarcina newyorkensis 2681]SKA95226.1 two-component system, CitB family, response regulator CitT [Sporosarcina newyorkensis]
MIRTWQVVIVEDDFRVAEINRRFVEQVSGFNVSAELRTAAETLHYLQQVEQLPDLILLDVYIPDSPGLELFWRLRKDFPSIAIILVTAAKETVTVEAALQGGVFDFLIKPVDFDRFNETFTRYRKQKVLLASKKEVNQEEVDRLQFGSELRADKSITADGLPKGIDRLTLERIEVILEHSPAEGINAIDTSEAAGVSRSTARRYLEYLVSAGKVKAQLQYGEVGRPERTYIKI